MNMKFLAAVVATVVLCLATDSGVFAQGKGKGGGQGSGGGQGKSNSSSSKPTSSDNDSTTKSNGSGKSDKAANKADKANDKADKKADKAADKADAKALKAKEKALKMSDNDLNRYKGLSKKLGTTPEEMRARYQSALMNNPDLTYGNFVSAHMAADNLGDRYPGVTSDAILIGMSKGRSLGQTLKDLRVSPNHSQTAQDAINARMKDVLGN